MTLEGEVPTMLTNERGLTLAEILVAVAIIGLGLVGLAVDRKSTRLNSSHT